MKYQNNQYNKPISICGFGGWQIGNATFWNGAGFDESVELVQEAIKKGVTFFDTAPGYSNGLSETIIGNAVKNHRNEVWINTKFGHTADGESDFSVSAIEREIKNSCQRLQTDYIDSVILHNPPHDILQGNTGHEAEFQRLKRTKLIRAYGVSIDTADELQMVLNHLQVDVIEIMCNIIHQSVIPLFEEVKKRGILLIIKVPLDSGWLTGKYDHTSVFDGIRSRWTQNQIQVRSDIVSEIKRIIKNQSMVDVALSFITSYDAVTTVIPGVKNKEQLEHNILGANSSIDPKIKQELEELYQTKIKEMDTPW